MAKQVVKAQGAHKESKPRLGARAKKANQSKMLRCASGKTTWNTSRVHAWNRSSIFKPKAIVNEDIDEERACADSESEKQKDAEHCFRCGHQFAGVAEWVCRV